MSHGVARPRKTPEADNQSMVVQDARVRGVARPRGEARKQRAYDGADKDGCESVTPSKSRLGGPGERSLPHKRGARTQIRLKAMADEPGKKRRTERRMRRGGRTTPGRAEGSLGSGNEAPEANVHGRGGATGRAGRRRAGVGEAGKTRNRRQGHATGGGEAGRRRPSGWATTETRQARHEPQRPTFQRRADAATVDFEAEGR